MNEKQYKVMSGTGSASIVLGIIMVVTGLAAGILSIVNGARLLSSKKELTF